MSATTAYALYLLAGAAFCWAMYARSIRRERKTRGTK